MGAKLCNFAAMYCVIMWLLFFHRIQLSDVTYFYRTFEVAFTSAILRL